MVFVGSARLPPIGLDNVESGTKAFVDNIISAVCLPTIYQPPTNYSTHSLSTVNTLDHMHEQLDSSLCPLVRELRTSWYKFHQEIVGKFPSGQ